MKSNPFRDTVFIVCATVIVTVIVAGFVALTLAGDSAVAFRIISLVVAGSSGLTSLIGVLYKVSQATTQAEANGEKLNALTNGALHAAILAALEDRASSSPRSRSTD